MKKIIFKGAGTALATPFDENGVNTKEFKRFINICFKDVDASRLIVMLDSNGIQVSSGSACNSGTPLPSYVLKEIGMSDGDAYSCIRITLNGEETYEELDYVVYMIKRCILIIRSDIF